MRIPKIVNPLNVDFFTIEQCEQFPEGQLIAEVACQLWVIDEDVVISWRNHDAMLREPEPLGQFFKEQPGAAKPVALTLGRQVPGDHDAGWATWEGLGHLLKKIAPKVR
ncbi:hypothetical protein V6K52_09175 [Knoellia sp. S7-12]